MKRIIAIISAILLILPTAYSCANKQGGNTAYVITAEYDDKTQTLKCNQKVKYVNNTETAVDRLKFNIFANAYRQDAKYPPIATEYTYRAYPNGKNYGDISFESAFTNKKSVEISLAGKDLNVIEIPLGKELFPDERIEVEFNYTVKLANVLHRLGFNDKTVNLGNWYPVLCPYTKTGFYECEYYSFGDPFFSEVANYDITFTYPEKYVVASSGNIAKNAQKGDKKILNLKGKNIRDFALCLSQDYKVVSGKTDDGVAVEYYYFEDQLANANLKTAIDCVNFYTKTFGKYPYDRYVACQTFLIAGGMEYSGLAMLNYGGIQYDQVIAHETAHQWWYGGVGNNQLTTAYIDEGLSEFSVALYLDSLKQGAYQEFVNSSLQTYKIFCTVYQAVTGKINTSMDRHLSEYGSEYEYINLNYVKPIIMLDECLKSIGKKQFFNSLKTLYNKNLFKIVGEDEFLSAFEQNGNRISEFLQSFISGKAII